MLPEYGRYKSAKLRDPQVVDAMAKLPPPSGKPVVPIEDWSPLRSDLADIKDLLIRVMHTTAHADPKDASSVARPEYPHEVAIRERKARKRSALLGVLIPEHGGG